MTDLFRVLSLGLSTLFTRFNGGTAQKLQMLAISGSADLVFNLAVSGPSPLILLYVLLGVSFLTLFPHRLACTLACVTPVLMVPSLVGIWLVGDGAVFASWVVSVVVSLSLILAYIRTPKSAYVEGA